VETVGARQILSGRPETCTRLARFTAERAELAEETFRAPRLYLVLCVLCGEAFLPKTEPFR
jgi:hypothetical protein